MIKPLNSVSAWIISLAIGCTAGATASNAGQFTSNNYPGQERSVIYDGTINKGDAAKFKRFIQYRATKLGLSTDRIFLNIDGGMVLESMKVADVVLNNGMDVVVGEGGHCVSACFTIFVAGRERWFTEKSYIGVHAALSYGTSSKGSMQGEGKETQSSRSATLSVAEVWASYGVPAGIIVKMMATDGNDVSWLSTDELEENGFASSFE